MAEPNVMGGLAGGVLIGIAAVLLLAANGRIAGISGIIGGLLTPGAANDRGWRAAFVLGLVFGAGLYFALGGRVAIELQGNIMTLGIGGLLVGFGTRLGSGCTSGHGVCGLARRSPRSLAATAVFMAMGVGTVYLLRHVF